MRRRRWWELAAILLMARYGLLVFQGHLDPHEVPLILAATSSVLAGVLLRWRFPATGATLVVSGAIPGLFVLWEGARSVPLLSLITIVWVLDPHVERIGRLLSPVISYAVLTAGLAAMYIGSVTLLGALLGPLAGSSSLAVAGSTLVVAALFGAGRRRVQAVVDRYFNRARYDAQRDLAALRARLHDKIEPEEAVAEMLATVQRTVQPATASVWLSTEGHTPAQTAAIAGSRQGRHPLAEGSVPASGGRAPLKLVDQLASYVAEVRRNEGPASYRQRHDWHTSQIVGDRGTRERKTSDSRSG